MAGALAFTALDATAIAAGIDENNIDATEFSDTTNDEGSIIDSDANSDTEDQDENNSKETTSEESNQSDETQNQEELNTDKIDESTETEDVDAVTEELEEDELADEELLEVATEEDEEEEIIKFKELDEITTHYKLALDSLKEKFPKKIIAYTNQDNEIEIRIYEWTPIDDYDQYLGDYTFKPVVDTDYTISEDAAVPELKVHVEDESDGPTGLITTNDSYEIPIYNDGISQSMLLRSAASTDGKYNGYEEGYLPEIRSQGSEGACWAFAAIGAVETDLIKNSGESSSIDLSELQLAYFTAHKYTDPKGCHNSDEYEYLGSNYLSNGGTATMANQALANKVGPVQEVYVPYSKGSNYVPAEEYALGHDYAQVQNIYEINIEDRAQVKKAILEHGSVSTSFYASDNGAYSSTYNSYYTATEDQNHAVMLVGWDDNFSRDNFMDGNKPLGNGAWLVRNSWNLDDYGKNGYFWLSYYDKSLLDGGEAIAYTVTKDMYDNVYSYASSEYTGAFRSKNMGGSLTAKVEYDGKIEAGEQIEAVGVQVLNTNSTIEVTVSDGTKSASGIYHNSLYGYYTIPLETPLEVTEPGKKITLTYKITAPSNEGAAIAFDSTAFNHLGNIYHTVYNDAGFTIGTEKYKEDAKVKLYTKNTGNITPTGDFETSTPSLYDHAETIHQIEATFDGASVNPADIDWSVVNDNIATVDANGLVTIKKAKGSTVVFGDYTVDGKTYRITVTVTVKPYTITYVTGEGENYRRLYNTYYPGVSQFCQLPGPDDAAKEGYALKGWKKGQGDEDEVNEESLISGLNEDLTLYPIWKRHFIELYYYEPNATGGYSSYKRDIETIYIDNAPYSLPAASEIKDNPNKYAPEGTELYAWSEDADGQDKITTISRDLFIAKQNIYTGKYKLTNELVLYPQYKSDNQYTLSFDANGGISNKKSKLITFGKAYGELPEPEKSGLDFEGWHLGNENGEKITENTIVAQESDCTVVAKWVKRTHLENKIVDIKYNSNNKTYILKYDLDTGKTIQPITVGEGADVQIEHITYKDSVEDSVENEITGFEYGIKEGTSLTTAGEKTIVIFLPEPYCYGKKTFIETTFTVIECTKEVAPENSDYDKWEIVKPATITEDGIKGYRCSDCNKLFEIAYSGINPDATHQFGEISTQAVNSIGINGVYDKVGNEIDSKFYEITDRRTETINNQYYGVITITFKEWNGFKPYIGRFDIRYKLISPCITHNFAKDIHPASFEQDGYYDELCTVCQKVKEGTSRQIIPKLGVDSVSFKIGDGRGNIEEYNGANEISYKGKSIEIRDLAIQIGNKKYYEFAESEDNSEKHQNFVIETSGLYGIGKANVKIRIADDFLDGFYKNAESEKTFNIIKDVETVSAPVGNNESTLEYGDLVRLTTETAGATIYVKVLTGDTTEALPQSDSEKEDFVKNATRYSTFKANYEGTIKVRALAVKTIDNNITYSDCVDIPFTVVSSWGDVNSDDTSVDNPRNLPKGLWISDKTMATITDAKTHSGTVYSGYAKTLPTGKNSNGVNYSADYRVFYNNKLLTYGTDYTISYKNNKNAGDNANIIINGKGKYVSSYIQEFSITPMPVDDAMLSITASGATPVDGVSFVVTENKKVQKPKLTISYTQAQYASFNATASKPVVRKLTEGKDFQVDYSNVKADPTDVGYSIPVTIKGNYTGTIAARKLMVIDANRRITNAKVTINANAVVLDGSDKKSEVNTTVTMKGTPLTEGKDYTITYTYNSKIPGYQPGEGVFSVGSYTATITGIGTYMGTMTKNFSVPAKAATKISAKTITVDCDKAVYKYADKIAFKVVDGDKELKQDKDYVVANVNSEKVGMSKATIYGIGAYTGSRTKAYTVVGTIITKDDVSYKDGVDSFTYTGSAETSSPKLIVTLPNPADSNATVSKTIEYGTSSFTVPGYDESYQITWPKDAVNVGTKSIKIKGTNGNATSLTLTYKVTKADITDAVVYLDADKTAKLKVNDEDELRDLPYTNAAPVIHFEFAGKDYYSNQSFGKANATFAFKGGYKFENTVTATITGKKNFTGKITGTFKIGTAYIDDNTITVGDIIAGNKFKAPSVKVVSKAGKTLAVGTNKDYTVEYLYNGNDDVHSRYESVNFNEKVESGTEYIARIKGSCNGYKGEKDIVFRAIDKSYDISKAKVSLNRRFLFDGRETLVSNDDITLVLNKEVVGADGFEIISTTLPRNKAGQLIAGNGKLRLHGVGAYAGYKDVTIPIEKAPVDYAITFKANRTATDETYLNIANKPATIRNKTGVFTLPSTGYSATSTRKVGSKYVTTKYILSYYYLESDESVKFAGTDSNGVTEINLRDLGFTMSQPVTIVAKFEKNVDATYKVTYNPGQYSTAGKAVSKTIKRGASYKIVKQTTFKRNGYKFEGWATTDGASTADINFATGKTIINAKPAGGELKLYPVWKKLE